MTDPGSKRIFLDVDDDGNIYVSDYYNNTMRKVTPEGIVTTIAGHVGQWGSTDGPGQKSRFSGPSGVRIDNEGNIIITDNNNNSIRKISSTDGNVSTVAGSSGKSGTFEASIGIFKFINITWFLNKALKMVTDPKHVFLVHPE